MKKKRVETKGMLVCFVVLMFSIAIFPSTGAQSAYKMIDNIYDIDRCRIDWPYVAYVDDRNFVTTGYDLFCRNMSTGDEWTVSSQLNDEYLTYIGDGYIIYDVDNGGGDIDVWGHNIATKTSFPIFTGVGTMQSGGYIYGGRYVIAYTYFTLAGDSDVIAYDLSTGTYINIATTGANEWFCGVSGNWVIYDYNTFPAPTNGDIYAYNLQTTATIPIANSPNNEFAHDWTSNYLVYQDATANILYLYKFSDASTTMITNAAVTPTWIYLSDSFVTWEDSRNPATAPDIYGYSIVSGTEFPICIAVNDQKFPWPTGNLVFWDDNRADPDGTPNNWGAGGTDAWHIYGKYLPNGTEFIITGAPDPYSLRLPIPYTKEDLLYYFGDHRNAFLYGYTPPGPPLPPADVYFYDFKAGKEYAVREKDSIKTNIRMTTMSPDTLVYWIEEETPGDNDIWGYWKPEVQQFVSVVAAFIPVAKHHLRQVNTCLQCIEENLPEDVPGDVQALLDEMQEHINNANTTGNSIYANNELLKALKCCEDIQEKLGITCPL